MAFWWGTRRSAKSVAKIVHVYDLSYAVEYGCEYRLRAEVEEA